MQVDKERILVATKLNKNKWITIPKLSETTEISMGKIRDGTEELVDDSYLKKYDIGPNNIYELTDKGEDIAQDPSEDVLMQMLLDK